VGENYLRLHDAIHETRRVLCRVPVSGWIKLIAEPDPVPSGGLVYSTRPRVGRSTEGTQFYVKGPDTSVLVAEAVAYELADEVGLRVPDWAWCRGPSDGKVYFASCGRRIRIAMDILLQREQLQRVEFLGACIAFDIWIANDDRNMGGIVAEPIGGRTGSEVSFVAIDFEKSAILRGVNRFEVTERYPPWNCRPKDELARHCTGIPVPSGFCDRIAGVSEELIGETFARVASDLGAEHRVEWADSACSFLASRGRQIHQLVSEAWNA
jgi:hypothetical protein